MVGETRDAETASISVRAAITGHLVLSTLHTNDAVSSVIRLVDMGIEPYLLSSALVGIVAQRLMREGLSVLFAGNAPYRCGNRLCRPRRRVCPQSRRLSLFCNGTGYSGRISIHEMLEIDKPMRELISAARPPRK